jgi:DNA-binding transcriptional ArsR family regulator
MRRIPAPQHSPDPGIARVAALIGDPGRAAMLCALLGGDEIAAGELADRAGVAANAASAHLAKLVAGGLLRVRPSGRRRFFRLADENVGRAIEALTVIAPPAKIVALAQSRISDDLRAARTCYDHLAGRVGVAVTAALARQRVIVLGRSGAYAVSPGGEAFFASLDVNLERVRCARRNFARPCLDWSERRPHLAGALGAALCDVFLARRWLTRMASSRALRIMPAGRTWLLERLSIDIAP